MNINEVKELLKSFDESSLKEFDLKENSFELYMNKNDMTRGQGNTSVVLEPANVAQTNAPMVDVNQPVAVTSAETNNEAPTIPSGTEIVSPIVGVVYLCPAPDKPNFKNIGDTVKKGEVICIVEAMKVMNEITSDIDGIVSEVLVDNEDVVEFGQPLFRIQ